MGFQVAVAPYSGNTDPQDFLGIILQRNLSRAESLDQVPCLTSELLLVVQQYTKRRLR